jgi:hypothetical protein
MRVLGDIDVLAGFGALTWAILAHTVLPTLAGLISAEAALAFGLVALGRAYAHHRRKDE